MANPYSGIAAQILQAYQNQANTLGGYAQGFSGNLQSLANSESESAMALLEQMGAPESQQQQVGDQAGGPVGDTLYGQTGYLPAEALGEQGNAFAAYAATLPGLLQQELQQNAAYFAAMHPPPSYSGGGGGGGGGGGSSSDGGDSGGLTPSQQLAIAKFEYDQEQDAMKWEFEMAKWEHELSEGQCVQIRKMTARIGGLCLLSVWVTRKRRHREKRLRNQNKNTQAYRQSQLDLSWAREQGWRTRQLPCGQSWQRRQGQAQ